MMTIFNIDTLKTCLTVVAIMISLNLLVRFISYIAEYIQRKIQLKTMESISASSVSIVSTTCITLLDSICDIYEQMLLIDPQLVKAESLPKFLDEIDRIKYNIMTDILTSKLSDITRMVFNDYSRYNKIYVPQYAAYAYAIYVCDDTALKCRSYDEYICDNMRPDDNYAVYAANKVVQAILNMLYQQISSTIFTDEFFSARGKIIADASYRRLNTAFDYKIKCIRLISSSLSYCTEIKLIDEKLNAIVAETSEMYASNRENQEACQ